MSAPAFPRAVAPADFPPPVDAVAEFTGPPVDPLEEAIEVGVAIVGGGPAGLACAIRLTQLVGADPALAERLGEVPVAVLEKGRAPGAHQLSGAIMDPGPLARLLPEVGPGGPDGWPHWGTVERERVQLLLDGRRSLPIVPTPPPFRNHGNHVVSVSELTRWLAGRAEAAGVELLAETVGQKLLVEDGRVVGVRTGDRGRGRDGEEKATFEPGVDVRARTTVLAEGCWGHLTDAAVRRFDLAAGAEPPVWALGVKEVWEVRAPLDRAIHTLGWPLRAPGKYRELGGAWVYPMNRPGEPSKVSIGFVAGLDAADAQLSVHDVLQQLKLHPFVRGILEGGTRVAWGAKAIPEGGHWAVPRLHHAGLAIVGDGGALVDVPRLKGIHLAIESGRLAAEEIARQVLAGSDDLSGYDRAVRTSPTIGGALHRSRNMRQALGVGLVAGGALASLMTVTKGRFPGGRWRTHRDASTPLIDTGRAAAYPRPDGALTFDKASSVFLSGNETRDDAPDHLRVARRVDRRVAEAWTWMCPAGVYELPDDAPAEGLVDVVVRASNCVQCGAITAKGGRLTPPEGGDGPRYRLA